MPRPNRQIQHGTNNYTAESLGISVTNTAEANSLAIEAAYLAMETAGVGWTIEFGPGVYEFNRTLEMTMPSRIIGVSGGAHASTSLAFPNNGQDGVRLTGLVQPGIKIRVDGGNQGFAIGEILTGQTGSGTVWTTMGRTGDWNAGTGEATIYVRAVTGTFEDNQILTGNLGARAVANGSGTVSLTKNSAGSELRSLQLYQHGGTVGGNGVTILSPSIIDSVWVSGFKENGFNVVASTGDNANANGFRILNCGAASMGGHGFYINGADSNAGLISGCVATSNKGWGFWDSSFLGNTFVACEADANGAGSYKCDDPNARTLFINCYVEGYQSPVLTDSRATWLGGLTQSPVIGGLSLVDGRWSTIDVYCWSGGNRSINSFISFGSPEGGGQQVYASMHHAMQAGGQHILRFDANGFYEWYDATYGTVGWRQPIYGAEIDGRWAVPCVLQFPNGMYIGNKRMTSLAAAPDTTYPVGVNWAQGDRIYNSAPVAGGTEGWVCIAGGTSGAYTEGCTATTNDTTLIVLNSTSRLGWLNVGNYLTINGTMARVVSVNADFASVGITTMTMSANIAAGSGFAIEYAPPTFKTFGNIAE